MAQIEAQLNVSTIFNNHQKSDPTSPASTKVAKKIIAFSHWKYDRSEITFFPNLLLRTYGSYRRGFDEMEPENNPAPILSKL
jgi:hypothetical protein